MNPRQMLSALALSLVWSISASAETIMLKADSWCPYNCPPGAGSDGYMVDIARKVLEPKGHKIAYELMPFSEAVDAARTGAIGGVPGVSDGDGRDLVFPKEPLGLSGNVIVVSKDRGFTYKGTDGLKGMKLGAIDGYTYTDELDAYIAANRNTPAVVLVSGDDATSDLIKLLLTKKVDAIVEDGTVVEYALTKDGMFGLFDLLPAGGKTPVFIAFSPKLANAQQIAADLDAGLAELRANGGLATILKPYGLKDWKK